MRRAEASSEFMRDALMFAALLVVSLGFYARAATFSFVSFDDYNIVLGHPNLYDETSLTSSLREIFIGYFPREEPLLVRDLTWAIDARIYGFRNPFGYHVGNLVLNALVVGLTFALFRRLGLGRRLAGALSLAFALLPIHVEPVCWVMGRKDLLAAFFMLLGLLMQSVELSSKAAKTRRLAYGAGLACCALALGSKISAMAFPVVLALHRAFHPVLGASREGTGRFEWRTALVRSVTPILPHALLSMAVFTWYHAILTEYGVIRSQGPGPLDPEHLVHVVQFLPLIAGEYVISLFLPYELSVYYRWPHVEIPLDAFDLLASGLWAVALSAVLGLLLWKRRDLAFFALFSLALMLPYSGLLYVGFWRADRYFYLASAGLLAIAGIALRDAVLRAPMARYPAVALAAVFICASAVNSWRHQEIWRDNETLWSYETNRSEPSLFSFQGLVKEYLRRATRAGTEMEKQAWLERAERAIERGLARNAELGRRPSPYRTPEQLQLARLHECQGRIAAQRGAPPAVQAQYFQRAFDLAPNGRSARLLAGSLFAAADTAPEGERERLIERSFDYFLLYVEYSGADPRRRDENQKLLEVHYAGRFPFLENRVQQAKRTYFP